MALMVTFPCFVHRLLATNIERDEQAEERGRGTLSRFQKELGIKGEMIQNLMIKRTYAEHESLQAKGTLFALSSSCDAVVDDAMLWL